MQRCPATGSKKDSIDLSGTGVLHRLTLMKTGTSIVLLRLRNSIVKESIMIRKLIATAAIAATIAAGAAQAGTVQPTFDLSGAWQAVSGGAASFFQEGTELTFINITGGYSHYYVGRYISPTKIEGIQHRVNRADGCSTEMLLVLTATSANNVSVWSKVLDSNCDLVKGQILTDSVARTF
jgi:hypothetical protein